MILINSFNIRSLTAILVRHPAFQKLYFDCVVCEVHPKQVTMHQNK